MKKILFILTGLVISSCVQETEADVPLDEDITEIEAVQIEEPIRAKRDTIHAEADSEIPIPMSTFSGTWFQVEYPGKFTASPREPIEISGDYEFVSTDEAKFTSPDGTVEFFVFSPQWGGDPVDYLVEGANEKTVAQSEDKANSDDPFAVSHHWVTYEDKEGKYTRSYHSLMTESTHHVFGVKYTSKKMYERYKAAYLAFKKSLQQFAD